MCCITGQSLIDIWTLVHLCFWIVVGSTLWAFKAPKLKSVVVCWLISLAWEVFEVFAFKLWPDKWQDPESWYNSFISDPLTSIIGVLLIWWALDHRQR